MRHTIKLTYYDAMDYEELKRAEDAAIYDAQNEFKARRAAQSVQFNQQQLLAIETVLDWFKKAHAKRTNKQVFFLSGYAGVGKTTVAREIADKAEALSRGHVDFIAPSGKAASRLKQKGCYTAKTLHGLIYNYLGEDEDENLRFTSKGAINSRPKLIVLDEASMVGEYDNKNLLNFGVPVLALGDIGQLEPVRAVAYYTEKNVDFLMTEIMRQGAESNIIRASMFLRQGKRLPVREYHDCKIRSGLIPLEELLAHCDEDSQILVGYNDTRRAINDAVRKAKGFDSPFPQPGEKVVCRFNQHDFGMMNGEQGIVTGYREVPIADRDEKALIYVNFKSLTTGREQRALFNPACFTGDEDERKAASKGVGAWDYGWALTVHSAQGSEWGRVLLKEEPPHNASYEKWMYTGATRAQRHLTIYNQ